MLILSGFKAFWRKKTKLPYFWSAVASSDEEMDLMSALEWFKLWMTIFIPPMSQKRMALSIYKIIQWHIVRMDVYWRQRMKKIRYFT